MSACSLKPERILSSLNGSRAETISIVIRSQLDVNYSLTTLKALNAYFLLGWFDISLMSLIHLKFSFFIMKFTDSTLMSCIRSEHNIALFIICQNLLLKHSHSRSLVASSLLRSCLAVS